MTKGNGQASLQQHQAAVKKQGKVIAALAEAFNRACREEGIGHGGVMVGLAANFCGQVLANATKDGTSPEQRDQYEAFISANISQGVQQAMVALHASDEIDKAAKKVGGIKDA